MTNRSVPASCAESPQLVRLLAEDADPDDVDRLMAHVHDCPACREALSRLLDEYPAEWSLAADRHAQASPEPGSDIEGVDAVMTRIKAEPVGVGERSIGPYRILNVLGTGGMGQVYECLDERLGRRVAVKSIKPFGLTSKTLDRLEQEARIHSRLTHPNIVALLDFDVSDGLPYLVMELVRGPTLRDALRQGRPKPCEAAALMQAVARAVQASHDLGIQHRDLKPSNILLQPFPDSQSLAAGAEVSYADCVPKVSDFGLARCFDVIGEETGSMTIMGTPAYMAPEQIRGSGREIGPASDIYALGVVLFEMMTLRVPFEGNEGTEFAARLIGEQPISPRRLTPKIPAELETICLKCLEKEPRHRYATAGELADDLRRFLENRPIVARPVGYWGQGVRWSRRNPGEALAIGLATISVVAFGIGGHLAARRQAELTREAEAHRRIADERLQVLQERYFQELEAAKQWFLILREMSDISGAIAADKIDRETIQSLYEKVVEHRFDRAYDLIRHPDFKNLRTEELVEANYLAALKTLTFDRPQAYREFQAAVDLAKSIADERPLNEVGRASALNANNFLGVFRTQEEDHAGSLVFYENAWRHYRLRPDEPFRNPDLKRFSVLVGRNLCNALIHLGRDGEAESIRQESERIDAMQASHP
jgi:serine/threonine protein kinase